MSRPRICTDEDHRHEIRELSDMATAERWRSSRPSRSAGGLLIRAQDETRTGEWRSSGGDSRYKRYSPLAQINRDNVKNLRSSGAARPSTRVEGAVSEAPDEQLPPRDADDDRRRAVRAGRGRTRRGLRCRDRRADLAPGPRPGDGERGERVEHARRRLLEGRLGSPAVHGSQRLSCTRSTCAAVPSRAFGTGGRVTSCRTARAASAGAPVRSSSATSSSSPAISDGAGDGGQKWKKQRQRTCAASTRGAASCCGRSTSCRAAASSEPRHGATSRGSSPAISGRGAACRRTKSSATSTCR